VCENGDYARRQLFHKVQTADARKS